MNNINVEDNIHDLVDFLKSSHQDGDLYRGQNRDYPTMLPSFFRSYAKDLASSNHIIEIDENQFQQSIETDARVKLKFGVMNQIIKDFGLGLGNIIAQQYGVSSEALDVTSDIDVAAYFATRKYPSYSHISDSGVGVIYRFRGLESDALKESFSLLGLNSHFESGMSSKGYYDFFVHKDKTEWVFDRDKWWGFQPSIEEKVWTPRFITDWSSLYKCILTDEQKIPLNKSHYIEPYKRTFSWKLTRFFSQSGGMIRPRIYWNSDTPSRFDVAKDQNEVQDIRLRGSTGPRFSWGGNYDQKFPKIIPSAAIKRRLIGVENLRADSNCQAYFFNHSEKRITGFYRRELWREPAEDPLYGALWQLARRHLFKFYGWEKQPPAVDDPEVGILDRGYRLDREVKTLDARDDSDLYRGQLEDAVENHTYGPARVIDYVNRIMPLMFSNDTLGAMKAAVDGLRLEPENSELLLGLSECFGQRKKPRWKLQTLEKALQYAPTDSWLLYKKAWHLTESGEFELAIKIIDQAIQLYDPVVCKYSDFFHLELRGVLAWIMKDIEKVDQIMEEMCDKGFSVTEMSFQVQWLMEQFPENHKLK